MPPRDAAGQALLERHGELAGVVASPRVQHCGARRQRGAIPAMQPLPVLAKPRCRVGIGLLRPGKRLPFHAVFHADYSLRYSTDSRSSKTRASPCRKGAIIAIAW